MVKGIWNKISVYCLNHDEPIKMEILRNDELIKTPFYACPGEGDKQCSNRLNLDDYQDMVIKLLDRFEDNEGYCTDFTNFTMQHKGHKHRILVKVLYYGDDEIRLGILNKTVLGIS